MSFRLVIKKTGDENFISCKDFFKNIKEDDDPLSPIKYDMCNFFLCLLVGLKQNLKQNLNDFKLQPSAFASKYIDSYISLKPLITGLLLSRIVQVKRIDRNEKTRIKEVLEKVLDINDPINLKKEYLDLMHEYYLGGYMRLLSEFNNKPPQDVSIFFEKFNKLIKN